MPSHRPGYTKEVEAALRERAIDNLPAPPLVVPEGHVPYTVAVGESVSEGTAPPAVVAAILRAQADVLDPPKKITRSTNDHQE